MMEAVRTSETSVNNHFKRQYNPEDSSEHHTRHRENLKSHNTPHNSSKENDLVCYLGMHFGTGPFLSFLALFPSLGSPVSTSSHSQMALNLDFHLPIIEKTFLEC
jgi:hypothetical protein